MEQHYIVVFGIANEPIGVSYTIGIIIPKYPGDPFSLYDEIVETIQDTSVERFSKFIDMYTISIKCLTRVF